MYYDNINDKVQEFFDPCDFCEGMEACYYCKFWDSSFLSIWEEARAKMTPLLVVEEV